MHVLLVGDRRIFESQARNKEERRSFMKDALLRIRTLKQQVELLKKEGRSNITLEDLLKNNMQGPDGIV